MKIANGIEVKKNRGETEIKTYLNGELLYDVPSEEGTWLYMRCRAMDEVDKNRVLHNGIAGGVLPTIAAHLGEAVSDARITAKRGLESLISFMSEFSFTPNFRFVNTLAHHLENGLDSAQDYVCQYFKLTDSPYAEEISHKVESHEFREILSNIALMQVKNTVNDRLRIYYGAQGTGKTTAAMAESDNLCVVCNSSMLPADLMEDFTFDDGKATFHPSALARCMEEGKPIVLDEINLLPFDSLRFLQGIADGKSEFSYKGNTIHIRDGFTIIGTMNLAVNGVVFGLPEPLVDRCAKIKEFKLTADQLMMAF